MSLLRIALLLLMAALISSCSTPQQPTDMAGHHAASFVGFDDFSDFEQSRAGNDLVLTSPKITALQTWDELVVSWNTTPEAALKVEARALYPAPTQYYILGLWSLDPDRFPRESVKHERDANGEVQTDTLVLKRPARRVQLRITIQNAGASALKFVGLSFLDRSTRSSAVRTNRAPWGRTLPVPEKSQLGHAGASGWCSPTSISMILSYWAEKLQRPELNVSVPEVANSVFDPNWPGTGNWPFNTAFAGHFPGMRAYVTRFDTLAQVEDWVASGVPVAMSVSSDILRGEPADEGNGHLIVCVGFTRDGDVVVNDPWADLTKGEPVRRTYPRETVLKSWQRSRQTVYLVYPERMSVRPSR